jgi:hypothetical protein
MGRDHPMRMRYWIRSWAANLSSHGQNTAEQSFYVTRTSLSLLRPCSVPLLLVLALLASAPRQSRSQSRYAAIAGLIPPWLLILLPGFGQDSRWICVVLLPKHRRARCPSEHFWVPDWSSFWFWTKRSLKQFVRPICCDGGGGQRNTSSKTAGTRIASR